MTHSVPSYSRFHAIISATPSAAGLSSLPPRPTYSQPHLSLDPTPPPKRRKLNTPSDNLHSALRTAKSNESAASRQRPQKFSSKDDLLAALKDAFKSSQHVDFHASFDESLDNPRLNLPHKSRVQNLTMDIWRATGYRFTVKDHPRISNGHKTRFWCSQDDAHRSKSSKLARLPNSTSKPRISSAGEALAKTRYSCKSRLLISSRDSTSPSAPPTPAASSSTTSTSTTGKPNKLRVITVRMHHHVAHEPYVDTSLPPDIAQAIYQSFGWSSVAGIPIAPLSSSTAAASAGATATGPGDIASSASASASSAAAAAVAAAYASGSGIPPDVLGFGRADEDIDGEGEGEFDGEGTVEMNGEMILYEEDAEAEGELVVNSRQEPPLDTAIQQQHNEPVPVSTSTIMPPLASVIDPRQRISPAGPAMATAAASTAASSSSGVGGPLYPNTSASAAAMGVYPQQQTLPLSTAATSAAACATNVAAVDANTTSTTTVAAAATAVSGVGIGHGGIPTPPLSASSVNSSHQTAQPAQHQHSHQHPTYTHMHTSTQTPAPSATTTVPPPPPSSQQHPTHAHHSPPQTSYTSSYPLSHPHPYFHPSPIAPPSHQRIPPPPLSLSPSSQTDPSDHPDSYHQRMLHHIHNIKEFCSGLEYQLQFNDYRMLDVLEREGEGFLRLVKECLKSEGRLVN